MTVTMDLQADRAVKDKHRAMWTIGNYSAVAHEVIPALGPIVVEAAGVQPGERVLDVAAGTGNAAIPAARLGARVTAGDLTPALLEQGRRVAQAQGLTLDWREADAERLPFADHEFDKVLSVVGVMFAPRHQASADELVRVCRPGGTIALASWTPQGFIGQMFATMKPYAPAPPPGAQPPPLWGDEPHVLDLLGDRVHQVRAERRMLPVELFDDGIQVRDYFKTNYGPTIVTYRGLADQPERAAALDRELAELGDRHLRGSGVMQWEYLLFTARAGRAGTAARTSPRAL